MHTVDVKIQAEQSSAGGGGFRVSHEAVDGISFVADTPGDVRFLSGLVENQAIHPVDWRIRSAAAYVTLPFPVPVDTPVGLLLSAA